jgi:hypothetical protein
MRKKHGNDAKTHTESALQAVTARLGPQAAIFAAIEQG